MITKGRLLEDLMRAYASARQHKRNESSALEFEQDFEHHLVRLADQIYSRTYKVARSTCFIITKPVKREIFAAQFADRVVHHLIFDYIAPLFERVFIEDSYSCRKGKGTLYGVRRIHKHIRSCTENFTKDAYILKLDIQGYFMNINRSRLYDRVIEVLQKMAPRRVYPTGELTWQQKLDYDLLEYLLGEVIFADPTIDCIVKGSTRDWNGLPANKSLFGTPADCGLPIGNLTSQLFSNVYLSAFDDYCKRELGLCYYGRYVDDFVVVHRDKKFLESLIPLMDCFLEQQYGLKLHPKKIYLQHYSKGVNFLGVTIKGGAIFPGKRMRKAAFCLVHKTNYRATKWQSNDMYDTPDFIVLFAQQVNSYLGQMIHCHGAKVRQNLVGAMCAHLRWWVWAESPIFTPPPTGSDNTAVVRTSPRKMTVVHKRR